MKKNNYIELSIIIPSFNEQDRLPVFLKSLFWEFNSNKQIEIILVDDGSNILNYQTLKEKINKLEIDYKINFQYIRYDVNRGKGFAINYGLQYAKGNYFAFIDADGATPAYELRRAWKHIEDNPDIDYLAGSRIVMFGRKVEKSFKRHLASRIFSTYFTLIYGIKMYDPQCGMKFFKKEAYFEVKEKISDFRWLWDTQLTILLYKKNKFRMIEFPIDWKDIPGSKVNLITDSIRMFFLLWKYRKILN